MGHIQAHTGAQCFAMVSGLNDMFPGNGVQRGLRYVFSCLVGVSEMSEQSAATCINHEVLKRQRTMGPSEVFTNVSAAARYTQQLKILEDMFVVRDL